MKKLLGLLIIIVLVGGLWVGQKNDEKNTGAPPGGVAEAEVPDYLDPDTWRTWQRPDVSPKVGIQVGHWMNHLAPEEQKNLRNNTGAEAGGAREVDINLEIASRLKKLLENEGVEVDLIPTTIEPSYWADVFIAIHADGSEDKNTSGYKFAGPWRDFSGEAQRLVSILETKYEQATGMVKDPNISRNMRGYYAFSWWRYEHAVHPMTTAVIAETGFVTNPDDREFLVDKADVSAKALADGIVEFLESEGLL